MILFDIKLSWYFKHFNRIGGATRRGISATILTNTGVLLLLHPTLFCREFGDFYFKFDHEELDSIRDSTGCGKPCRYMEYKIQGEGIPTFFKSEHSIFSLLASSRFFQLDFSQTAHLGIAGTPRLRKRSFFTRPPP